MSVRPTFTQRLLKPRHKWGRLAVVLIPVAVLGVWLKAERIDAFFPSAAGMDYFVKIASDISFALAWVLLWAVLSAVGPRWFRTANFYLAHLASLVLGLYLAVNHSFVMRTGGPLTWDRLEYAWRNREGLGAMVGSEVTSGLIALLIGVGVCIVVAPLAIGPLVSKIIRRPSARIKALGATAAVGLLAGSLWSAPTASAAFSLAAPVQLAVTEIRQASAYPEALEPTGELPDFNATTITPRTDGEHRNLVVMVLESQRASSTLPETRQPVTPFLDELAETSLTAERGYTTLPHTSKAITGIHCGVAPPLDPVNSEADDRGLPARCLPSLLGEMGYNTAFFQSATEHFERRRKTVRNLGFDYFQPVNKMDNTGFRKANYFGYEDDIMLEPVRKYVERKEGAPFMVSILTVTGHHDYVLEGNEEIDFVDNKLLNRYLNAIHYQDGFVSRVIDLFKEMGHYEDTVFVIVGDHGEGFGEHRIYQHDNTIYEEGLRVPLMIHDPQRTGELVEGPVSQLAIMPSVLDTLGFDLSGEQDFKPSLYSGEPQGPVVATCEARGKCIATMDGDMKLIHHFGDRRDEVFNLVDDNYERNDLATEVEQSWMGAQRDTALEWYLEWEARDIEFQGVDSEG